MATMKEVADRAGVSLSTVSYVLSGIRPISPETKQRVTQAMTELNFHPHAMGRALASRRTRILALLLSPGERGLGSSEMEIVRAAAEEARARNHHLVLLTEGMETESDLDHLQVQGLVDGVILMEVRHNDPRPGWFAHRGLPFTLVGRRSDLDAETGTDLDFEATARSILVALHQDGHREVAFINQDQAAFASGYGPAVRMPRAMTAAAAELGMTCTMWLCETDHSAGYYLGLELSKVLRRPTALVVMNDRALPGILQAFSSLGVRVPEDMSVVAAVTSAAWAQHMVPRLSAAEIPVKLLAFHAVADLIRQIEQPQAQGNRVLLPCTWTPRQSTGPASASAGRKET